MKFLFYVVGLGLALMLGLVPAIERPRPRLTKLIAMLSVACVVVLAFYPPIVGTFADAVRARTMHLVNQEISVVASVDWTKLDSTQTVNVVADNGIDTYLHFRSAETVQAARGLGSSELLFKVRSDSSAHNSFEIVEVLGTKPLIMLPYIPALEERSRVMFFHVPMSWVGFLAFIMTLIYSVRYLRSGNMLWETKAASSAAIGTLFCVLAYVTGALWAKFNWGKFFNWDTRELSVLILLLIYGAYFALRSSINEEERRARLASVYAIVACVAALFLMFIVPRMTESLHPGSRDDSNAGPILSPQADAINTTKAMIFSLSLSSFTLLYFWLLSMGVRISILDQRARLTALHHD